MVRSRTLIGGPVHKGPAFSGLDPATGCGGSWGVDGTCLHDKPAATIPTQIPSANSTFEGMLDRGYRERPRTPTRGSSLLSAKRIGLGRLQKRTENHIASYRTR